MIDQPIRIGTRGSALALVQAALVARALEAGGHAHRVVIVETAGDRRSPDTAWGEGAFVAAIEEALLDGRVDVAVHSAKDVPTDEDPRLRIGAYLERADPRDALVLRQGRGGTLGTLPAGSIVGTDSPRRTGFVLARRPDLVVRPVHGNVDTRLRRLDEGQVDALVLAVAGLERLGLGHRVTEGLDPSVVPPAPGQGAIAVQARATDEWLTAVLGAIDHAATRAAVTAERALLRALGGGCRAPIGALATISGPRLHLATAIVADDRSVTRAATTGSADTPEAAAIALAAKLRASRPGVPAPRPTNHAVGRPRVIVTRPVEQADGLVAAVRGAGFEPVHVPAIRVAPIDPNPALDEALRQAPIGSRVVATSANGARAAIASLARTGVDPGALTWAAVGVATRQVLESGGIPQVWLPSTPDVGALASELPLEVGARVTWVRGPLADGEPAEAWRRRGASVVEIVGYQTELAPASSGPLLAAALDGPPPAAVLFASGSAVEGLLRLAGEGRRTAVLALPAVCIGPRTAAAARAAGFTVLGSGLPRDAAGFAALTARLVRERPVGASS